FATLFTGIQSGTGSRAFLHGCPIYLQELLLLLGLAGFLWLAFLGLRILAVIIVLLRQHWSALGNRKQSVRLGARAIESTWMNSRWSAYSRSACSSTGRRSVR